MRTADGSIVRRCLDGDSAAFGFLVDKYRAAVYALAYSRLGDFHDAEDVAQEAFIKAYRNLRTLRRWDNFHAWLCAITINLCKDFARERARRPDREFLEDQDPEKLEEPSLDSYHQELARESIREALDSLPDMHRQVLSLHYLGGMSTREIAEFIGISPTAVRQRLTRARLQLKEEMLAMMGTTFEGQRLQPDFTLRVVEIVNRTKIHPVPRIAGLPWGLSLTAGIIIAVLSLNPRLDSVDFVTIPARPSLSSEGGTVEFGEMPVDLLTAPETSIIPSQQGSDHGGESGQPGLQSAFALAAPGWEYAFVRSWPDEILGLRGPHGVATDNSGNVYVADSSNHRIQKFDSNGNLIKSWGSFGLDDGQFDVPCGIALDSSGNVYVADTDNNRIQKFDSEGKFLTKWGTYGDGDGQFSYPCGIAVDRSVNVYVLDYGNSRIQKFDSQGKFLTKWGTAGKDDGQFDRPEDVAIDGSGNVYVVDIYSRVQKFDSEGKFLMRWGSQGSGNGQLFGPEGIATDGSGNVYVADTVNHRIQKFDSQGRFLEKWGTLGNGDGQFRFPRKLVVDNSGNIYVADTFNNRIQKLNLEGGFLAKFGDEGSSLNGQFGAPYGLAFDSSGNLYVADQYNHRIQKFGRDGNFLLTWGNYGTGNGQFSFPRNVAVDGSGNVYVIDTTNRVQKFDSDGKFLKSWGGWGNADGQLGGPWDVAVSRAGDVYVIEYGNCRVQVFDSNGKSIGKWGTEGNGDGQFKQPEAIAVDDSENVYVTDTGNHRIQVFNSRGRFLRAWGTQGSDDGQLNQPRAIAVDNSDHIYVPDYENHRIQVFDSDGNFLAKWGTRGVGDMEFWYPCGIAISSSGDVYVADSGNNRIKVYRRIVGGSVDPTNKQPTRWGHLRRSELYQNFPNPFNPETWIPYQLAEDSDVAISIYNVSGKLVRKLKLGQKPSGAYLGKEKAAYWDGRNDAGEPVASDVYFYVMETGESYADVRKMVMVR